MTDTPPLMRLREALLDAQRAVKPVSKDAHNDHHGYNYASADAIITEARECLHSAGLLITPLAWDIVGERASETDEKGVIYEWTQYRLHTTYELAHVESGEIRIYPPFTVPIIPERGRPMDKAEAGARTYSMSYFLRDLLLIPRTGADDRDGWREDGQPRAPKPQAAKPQRTGKPARPERPGRMQEAQQGPPEQQQPPAGAAPGQTATPAAQPKKAEDPRDVVSRLLSAIEILDGRLGRQGAAVAQARALLGGVEVSALERAAAVALIGPAGAPGPLRALRDELRHAGERGQAA